MQNSGKETKRKSHTKRLIKAGRHLFIALHALLVIGVLLVSALFYIAFRPDGLSLVSTFFLEPLGIHTSRTEGSLSEGFSLHGLHSQTIDAKTLTLDYNLTAILKGKHVVDSIRIDGLRIHLDDFIRSDDSPSLPLPIFTLKEVTLTNLQLISSYPIELNIHGKNGSFDGENLNFKTLTASARTQYASGALKGILKNNIITGRGVVYPNASQLDPYVAQFVTLPSSHPVEILELSDTQVRLSTKFNTLNANFDPKISLHATTLEMDYRYENNYLDFTSRYTLLRDDNQIQTSQKLRYSLNGVTTTTLTGEILHSTLPLPSTVITGSFRDDPEGLAGKLSIAQTSLLLQSSDYDVFHWSSTTNHENLYFLHFLPKVLQNSPLTGSARGEYRLKNSTVHGKISLHHNHADINATLHASEDKVRIKGEIFFPSNAPSWEKWSMKPPPKLDFSLSHKLNKTDLSLSGDSIALWGEVIENRIQGSGNYLGTFFDINGTQGDTTSNITLSTLTPSLYKTLTLIPSITLPSSGYYDAEVRTKTHITYDTQLHIETNVEIPWYAIVLDSKRHYSGTNNSALIHYNADQILIGKYRLNIADHEIGSSRPSYLHFDPDGNLSIDEIWIFDTLLLNGMIDTSTWASSLNLSSENFTYKGPEGEAHIALDLHFQRDGNATQSLKGKATLLDGQITYLPLHQFKVMDDDVIIVQDVVAPSDSTLEMEIKIDARQSIHYHTKELDILLIPELTLWKDPKNTMQILGMISIPSGTVTTSGKQFTLRPSTVYFGGEIPLNPYLDITVNHEVDYKKIQIYITHRLDSPIFLFSSDPVMNQNDIMSYILFGASSDTTFNSSGGSNISARADATNFMLGAGLKGLIGGATKLQIDTMNILTTRGGGMGFEVGARLNKDFRVLYKNDTISSVLIQYTVNRWLRLDADIHELGQGINAIYIKDFHDFLPHNETKREIKGAKP